MRPSQLCSVLIVALGLSGCPSSEGDETPKARVRIDAERFRVPLLPGEFARGGDTPLVTVVIYTDYACPPCGRTWTVMDNLLEDYGDDLRVIFRSYTVPGFGKGEEAVEAAFAAGDQGKFWEMHHALFEHIGAFDRPMLRKHAQAIGLDVPKFMDALDTGAHTGTRMRHRREAKRLGIVGLPASFVNGLYMAGYADEDTWHAILDEEIARSKELLAAGTPRAELYDKIIASASTKQVQRPKGTDALEQELADKKQLTNPPANLNPPDYDARYAIEVGESPALGPDDALVQVVELLDFQCPYCRKAQEELLEIRKKRGEDANQVQYVIRHVPLEVHTAAKGAAKASVAAGKQGKFWEFHDALFAYEGALDRVAFVKIAADLGLDAERFSADLDSTAVSQAVDDDLRLSLRLGVMATPGFFINGRYISGFRPGQLDGVIQEELDAAQALIDEGVPADQVRARIMAEAIGPEGYPNP